MKLKINFHIYVLSCNKTFNNKTVNHIGEQRMFCDAEATLITECIVRRQINMIFPTQRFLSNP